jgi:hypothetical protein
MRIQPAFVRMAVALLLAGCGTDDAPPFAGSWRSTDGVYEMSVLGTGTRQPNRYFIVSGDVSPLGGTVVFTYQDDGSAESYVYSQTSSAAMTLSHDATTIAFERE